MWLEALETDPAKYLPEVADSSLGGDVVKVDLNRPMSQVLTGLGWSGGVGKLFVSCVAAWGTVPRCIYCISCYSCCDLVPELVMVHHTRRQVLEELSRCPVKTRLSLTGTLVVARDIAHSKLLERLKSGGGDSCIYPSV